MSTDVYPTLKRSSDLVGWFEVRWSDDVNGYEEFEDLQEALGEYKRRAVARLEAQVASLSAELDNLRVGYVYVVINASRSTQSPMDTATKLFGADAAKRMFPQEPSEVPTDV